MLPDGWRLWGLFTELIDGPSLQDLPLGEYSLDAQSTLVRLRYCLILSRTDRLMFPKVSRIRHGLRALKYAGVDQSDWHLDQILCPQDGGTLPPDIVFIDFAFALLWLADSNGTPRTTDYERVESILIETDINAQVLKESWFPQDMYEK